MGLSLKLQNIILNSLPTRFQERMVSQVGGATVFLNLVLFFLSAESILFKLL
jgi:hypothetical protein